MRTATAGAVGVGRRFEIKLLRCTRCSNEPPGQVNARSSFFFFCKQSPKIWDSSEPQRAFAANATAAHSTDRQTDTCFVCRAAVGQPVAHTVFVTHPNGTQTNQTALKHVCTILFKQSDCTVPIAVATRSKAWVCGRSLTGIAGSNPA
jgi:hypothetical protein